MGVLESIFNSVKPMKFLVLGNEATIDREELSVQIWKFFEQTLSSRRAIMPPRNAQSQASKQYRL